MGRSTLFFAGNTLRVPQPFPYQGSKRKLAGSILQCIRPGKSARFFEPFAGSAAISLAVASASLSKTFIINDAHKPLVDLWTEIINRPTVLATEYERLWNEQHGDSRRHYDEVRAIFNKTGNPVHFLYLLARCVKAAIRYNRNGEFNNSPDKRRFGMRPASMRMNLMQASSLLIGRTTISCDDYREVLASAKKGDFIYMDPPYQGVCKPRDNRYAKSINHVEFVNELDKLNSKGIAYIVSYDGRTGDIEYGERMPESLGLAHFELCAGRSTQATLLGRGHDTYESLYLSPALIKRLGGLPELNKERSPDLLLFGN